MNEDLLHSARSLNLPLSGAARARLEQDDAQLVRASQHGDREAFALLVQRYQRRVFNMILRMLQDYEEACEITQEAFLAAWQGLPTFRGEARFPTWLYRIAYNCCLRQLEQRRRDKALQNAMQEQQLLDEAGGQRCQAESTLEARDRQALVREQLEALPTKYRIVLVLRHLQEMTYEEMAEILMMPIGTIKTHLFRARNLLKERLQAQRQADSQKAEVTNALQ
ncbi:MAG: sigma-70 family RNA polymerase sigma factor [Thermogemmatispora sp.]|jgi:RNA polymerase sigma-70 factor (ECF subfamily)|uniref:RNA polymerase sigma factor n=1 Tax=Thermogemmatispora aurantia TaxID=2045279 RepID=A0A5J4KC03_9CHLR|nr:MULTISPECIES: sigma-70 family RNA polymerase sigma factor [Thermogemmatispora]MBE3567825.1 sigma-70 family RNA polymerase sigma factor [Thermogemmatispora sp.]GER84552.1 RNA polymerase sigma factor [Thermogemmatispora aurantia]